MTEADGDDVGELHTLLWEDELADVASDQHFPQVCIQSKAGSL